MPHVTLTAVLTPESGGYVSLCPELDIASQGESVDEALANLKEAVEGFYETASSSEITNRLSKPSLVTHIEVAYA
ncbi:MAG: type II toxin-antitoxin system HicB family antitoxin [Blastochloris sp.]|nr:type II toxin-antitoxin system HicB family antitoxin [Blastochloris sp.]